MRPVRTALAAVALAALAAGCLAADATLVPQGFADPSGGGRFVWLASAEDPGESHPARPTAHRGCIWFVEREDFEMCLDAIESLAHGAREGRTR